MSVAHNVALAYRVVEEVWNGADLGVADALFAPAYVNHGGLISDLVRGPEAIEITVALYRTAFPDLHSTVEHLIAENDLVVVHCSARNMHPDEVTGSTRAERPAGVTGMTLCRLAGGKIVESWEAAGVLSRLGVIALDVQARP